MQFHLQVLRFWALRASIPTHPRHAFLTSCPLLTGLVLGFSAFILIFSIWFAIVTGTSFLGIVPNFLGLEIAISVMTLAIIVGLYVSLVLLFTSTFSLRFALINSIYHIDPSHIASGLNLPHSNTHPSCQRNSH